MNSSLFPIVILSGVLLAACTTEAPDSGNVDSSGKLETSLQDVPEAVVDAALAARPSFEIAEAEYETRDGREYYDLGGRLPDGSEVELDMMLDGDSWRVVEVQRDVEYVAVPESVQEELAANVGGWTPTRVIESDQGGGVVIYEFFGLGADGASVKHEVRLAEGTADFLREEWAH